MKKLILAFALLACTAIVAAAQPRSVGGRVGYGIEASYQHTVGTDFVEADLGLNWYSYSGNLYAGWNVAAVYDFMIAKPDWTDRGEWGFYAGPGATVSFGSAITLGIGGQVGLEYIFESIPLQLSLDYRPMIGTVYTGGSHGFWGGGLLGFGLAARYCF